jgi:hypothetical protein
VEGWGECGKEEDGGQEGAHDRRVSVFLWGRNGWGGLEICGG